MIRIIKYINLFKWFFKIGYKYIFFKSSISGCKDSLIQIEKDVKILNSKIFVHPGSSLFIGKGTVLKNVDLNVHGEVILGEHNLINNGGNFKKLSLSIHGTFLLGNFNRIQSRILLRYSGKLSIGNYNNINQDSEIRIDEKVEIEHFNQISYGVVIWDTNTHNIYPFEVRRKLTVEKFPAFGFELEKPKTKPIFIGSDCWVGREAALLKGSNLKDGCIVGFRTVLSDFESEKSTTIVSMTKNKIFPNNVL